MENLITRFLTPILIYNPGTQVVNGGSNNLVFTGAGYGFLGFRSPRKKTIFTNPPVILACLCLGSILEFGD